MNYLLSAGDKYILEFEAGYKRKLKGYAIITKRTTFPTERIEDVYDLYELEEDELALSFSGKSINGFKDKYMTEPLLDNQEMVSVTIYHEREIVHEIGIPMKVLIFEPNKPAYEKEMEYTKKTISEIVGGYPEYVGMGVDDMVLICNEEGMLLNLPQHRGLYGTFLVTGLLDGECVSLTENQIKKAKNLLDKKQNYESKSKYLKEYFQTHEISRKMFTYSFENMHYHIATESIIDYILAQPKKEDLQLIELEIRDIERNKKDIYPYLESVGYQMAKQQSGKSFF